MWDLPRSGTEPVSPALASRFFTTEPPGKPHRFPEFYSEWKLHRTCSLLLLKFYLETLIVEMKKRGKSFFRVCGEVRGHWVHSGKLELEGLLSLQQASPHLSPSFPCSPGRQICTHRPGKCSQRPSLEALKRKDCCSLHSGLDMFTKIAARQVFLYSLTFIKNDIDCRPVLEKN